MSFPKYPSCLDNLEHYSKIDKINVSKWTDDDEQELELLTKKLEELKHKKKLSNIKYYNYNYNTTNNNDDDNDDVNNDDVNDNDNNESKCDIDRYHERITALHDLGQWTYSQFPEHHNKHALCVYDRIYFHDDYDYLHKLFFDVQTEAYENKTDAKLHPTLFKKNRQIDYVKL